MSMASILQILATVSFVLTVVLLALAIFLFFVLDIRSVIEELTGKTATVEIARIREQGATRKHKARSLQSIVFEDSHDSTDFSLGKLNLGATEEASEQMTILLDEDSMDTSEQMTVLLAEDKISPETSEEMTVLLADESLDTSEQATILLNNMQKDKNCKG